MLSARYNHHFVVTKEELEYMISRIEVLKELTERICKERLAWYTKMAEKEGVGNTMCTK